MLGYLYEQGSGVKADSAEAVKWYRKSADQNNPDGLFHMGRAYENGIGVKEDWVEAVRGFAKAQSKGMLRGNSCSVVCINSA